MALQIRRIAEAHNVPVFEHPQFARALFFTSDLGREVSPRLYVAVAQVLTYVYQLTGRATPGAKRPRPRGRPTMPVLSIDPDLTEPRRGRRRGIEA
jgi:flagellar biosynthetic protein FlhB